MAAAGIHSLPPELWQRIADCFDDKGDLARFTATCTAAKAAASALEPRQRIGDASLPAAVLRQLLEAHFSPPFAQRKVRLPAKAGASSLVWAMEVTFKAVLQRKRQSKQFITLTISIKLYKPDGPEPRLVFIALGAKMKLLHQRGGGILLSQPQQYCHRSHRGDVPRHGVAPYYAQLRRWIGEAVRAHNADPAWAPPTED